MGRPRPAEGTFSWCTGHAQVFEGVWLGPEGEEIPLFRAGVSGDRGCYAWLHPVPRWQIEEEGVLQAPAQEIDGGWSLGYPGSRLRVFLGNDGRAGYHFGDSVTLGRHPR